MVRVKRAHSYRPVYSEFRIKDRLSQFDSPFDEAIRGDSCDHNPGGDFCRSFPRLEKATRKCDRTPEDLLTASTR